MNNKNIMSIGDDVASNWGAVCISYERNETNNGYLFLCKEYGEEPFYTEVMDYEIKGDK